MFELQSSFYVFTYNTSAGAYGRLHDHHERRYHKLNKQASKDSTDGSICSISSDSSNA